MAKQKIDGVVEAVRYNPSGQIEWVRAYERRGAAFTDRVLIDRADFIARLKAGKRFLVGKRIPYLGGTFETALQIQLAAKNGSEIIVAGNSSTEHDHLEGVPIL
jgi:hypothetical protein